MSTDVVMPQMGESIAEGTIVRWIKKVGDQIARDEPLFEISTDKVDAEIPSPAAGILAEIRVKEGETVPVNSVVAVIGQAGDRTANPSEAPGGHVAEPPRGGSASEAGGGGLSPATPLPGTQPGAGPGMGAGPAMTRIDSPGIADSSETVVESRAPVSSSESAAPAPEGSEDLEDRIRQRSSPLVRKIAQEHHVDISQIHGTGISGRVTKRDILDFISGPGDSAPPGPPVSPGASAETQTPASGPAPVPASGPAPGPPARGSGVPGQVQPMSVMRKKIAEHMIMSRRTSAHVHSVFEVNFTRVAQIREAKKAEYERAGAKLTYLSFIVKAVVDALRAVPVVNASIDGDNVVYHPDVNLGIAVALDWGLIVPVIKKADERNLLGLSRAVADLAGRARTKQLKPDEVTGGTFTITNPGVFGALFGMPIISQPQVGILGVGHIEKRPVVIDDAIAIRSMAYLTLGYDHRLIDGAVADQFLSHVKHRLETWDLTQA
jgi:pyruvate dehydrogenase E2 component (dihydrolipoamide acetyltransferase)